MYSSSTKIIDLATLKRRILAWRIKDEKVVFTNGCFDLLHPGHVDYLEKAHQLGNRLIVGLNSDASVRKLKGESRPLVPQDARARVLAGLSSVDAIIFFDEETPESLIQELKPDVLAKGADYEESQIAGAAFVRSIGGTVERIPLVEGYSTTDLLRRIRES
jgi:D-beta-D-heptose 7-phosphate kinase/D-beta-D-heptose 1-phosphate adenosyltransferase